MCVCVCARGFVLPATPAFQGNQMQEKTAGNSQRAFFYTAGGSIRATTASRSYESLSIQEFPKIRGPKIDPTTP